jgi:hypothetical protein
MFGISAVLKTLLRTDDTNKLFSKIMKITAKVLFTLIKWIILTAQISFFSWIFFHKNGRYSEKKFVWTYMEKSRVLNIIAGLQVPNILENCYLYSLLWIYVKKYISIQVSIFLFVPSILKNSHKDASLDSNLRIFPSRYYVSFIFYVINQQLLIN